jgi:flavorubredoxin
MRKILVLYYSRTGNTEKMAKALVEEVKLNQNVDVALMIDFEPQPINLAEADAIVVGMPTYHHDMTRSVKRLFEQVAVEGIELEGKIGASFGSYGWSGEAPRLILEIMQNKFKMEVIKPPLLVKYAPDKTSLEECRGLGKKITEKLLE